MADCSCLVKLSSILAFFGTFECFVSVFVRKDVVVLGELDRVDAMHLCFRTVLQSDPKLIMFVKRRARDSTEVPCLAFGLILIRLLILLAFRTTSDV